ncbi:hypothetical protein HYQ80_004093 [Salmonella enterica]|uniref:Fimbrial protein n=1 Tax=Salmonella enterica TaxID=28901 RepID=A0A5Z3BCA8_SALER|nr:hypothetical protein [Salmonella enterica]ECL6067864.1 hypothetical protein [Salmonella enterica]ECL6624644.1 hypothetical protein [Salmonella enterica]ECP1354592.1 hypothetical protein [Salmonella enterica]ECR6698044.1 hypothetical protein [Salmonella enterica]
MFNTSITTDMPQDTKIGTMTVTFTCQYSENGIYWKGGIRNGGFKIPLPDFNYVSIDRLIHKSGWIYLKQDTLTNSGVMAPGAAQVWNAANISFDRFSLAMNTYTSSGSDSQGVHTFGIYTAKQIPGNVLSSTQTITMLTAITGMQAWWVTDYEPLKEHFIPVSLSNNETVLSYINTVTCSISSDKGSNVDLGTVNLNGDFKKPLTTITLKMSCGLGTGGGNLTSNYPSFIVPGATLRIEPVDFYNSSFWPIGNVYLDIGNGWGLRFDTNGSPELDLNHLDKIVIGVYPIKLNVSAAPGGPLDWNGAMNFTVIYN